MACIVYGLMDMEVGQIRYVGQTTRTMKKRFAEHVEHARQGRKTPVHCWIKSILDRGGEVGIMPIIENAVLHETEVEVIARLKDEGYDLLNLTDGGEGTLGWIMSDEQRERHSEQMRERFEDPEFRERNAACGFGFSNLGRDCTTLSALIYLTNSLHEVALYRRR